jgi:hypothetical protein
VVAGGNAVDGADMAEHGAGHDRPDAVDLGDRRTRLSDGASGATLRLAALLIQTAQIGDQVAGELECHPAPQQNQ